MLSFERQTVTARFIDPAGEPVSREIEIRRSPITGRTCRIAFSREQEHEPGTGRLPSPPPDWNDTGSCPFCSPQVFERTPRLHPDLGTADRMALADSLLFPNLFPYGCYSAVSLFGNRHFVEIGTGSVRSYADSLVNCRRYLSAVRRRDPGAVHVAITQNHLPSAGGSLLHPHLQVNADRIPANHQRFLKERSDAFFVREGSLLFSEYIEHERNEGSRYLGRTGPWEWAAAFAPEGFFEIWGVLPGATSIPSLPPDDWSELAEGIISVQRFYRSICRNGCNFGLLSFESDASRLELRAVMTVRPNHAAWVRSDFTGYEIMLGDMTTFVAPERTAEWARPFFTHS